MWEVVGELGWRSEMGVVGCRRRVGLGSEV